MEGARCTFVEAVRQLDKEAQRLLREGLSHLAHARLHARHRRAVLALLVPHEAVAPGRQMLPLPGI
jgi:hypothetical protein